MLHIKTEKQNKTKQKKLHNSVQHRDLIHFLKGTKSEYEKWHTRKSYYSRYWTVDR